MILEGKASYNEKFWDFLNYRLRIEFVNTEYKFKWIYPFEINSFPIFIKGKRNGFGILKANALFDEENEEREYSTEIFLGKYSSKVYLDVQGTDLVKCFPKHDFQEWVKIDELNNKITIQLK